MAERILIVVDMQNDFVNGSLGSSEAQQIVNRVVDKVKAFEGQVIFTQDTHEENYMSTQEGKLLPVPHCIEGTAGWQLVPELEAYQRANDCPVYKKDRFGSIELARHLITKNIESIELVGLCTDICVVSNALLLKAYLSEVPISVDASCCAGVTPQKHEAALETMRSCQICVKNEV